MSGLLPSMRDTSAAEESSPRVIDLTDEDADDLIGALSSETARDILAALHDEPATLTEVAEAVDTTRQNAQYHVQRLREADAVEVVDVCYSEKGTEMKVYAPADRPLVVVSGPEESTSRLRDAVRRLLGALGVVGIASALVQFWLRPPTLGAGAADGAEPRVDGGDGAVEVAAEADQAAQSAADSLAATYPGLLFFLGAVSVLLVGFAYWYVRHYR